MSIPTVSATTSTPIRDHRACLSAAGDNSSNAYPYLSDVMDIDDPAWTHTRSLRLLRGRQSLTRRKALPLVFRQS